MTLDTELLKNEAEWSEILFSYLTAGWYDWAVANHLSRNGTHCWSVTSSYYAQYILASSCVMAWHEMYRRNKYYLRDITESHSRLSQFFSGGQPNDTEMSHQFVEYMAKILHLSLDQADHVFTTIGHLLKNAKKARESHTYHVLVVSHQVLRTVRIRNRVYQVSDTVQDINEKLLELVPEINFLTLLVVENVFETLRPSIRSLHYKHLVEEIDEFYLLAEKEGLLPLPEVLEQSLANLKVTAKDKTEQGLDLSSWNSYKRFFTDIDIKVRNYDDLGSTRMKITEELQVIQQLNQRLKPPLNPDY